MPVISLRDDSMQLHMILAKEALCPVSLNVPQGSSDVCTSLVEVWKQLMGSVFGLVSARK